MRFRGRWGRGFRGGWGRDALLVHHFEIAEVGVEHDVEARGGDEEGEREIGEGGEEVYWRGDSVSIRALGGELGEGERHGLRSGCCWDES